MTTKEFQGKSQHGLYGDNVEEMDGLVGKWKLSRARPVLTSPRQRDSRLAVSPGTRMKDREEEGSSISFVCSFWLSHFILFY